MFSIALHALGGKQCTFTFQSRWNSKIGPIIRTMCRTSLPRPMKRYHLLSRWQHQCSTVERHCLRRSPMTSPSQSDRMESHLWADRMNPQSGCKNTTNDRRGGKNTHEHAPSQLNYCIRCLRRSGFNAEQGMNLLSVRRMIWLSEADCI